MNKKRIKLSLIAITVLTVGVVLALEAKKRDALYCTTFTISGACPTTRVCALSPIPGRVFGSQDDMCYSKFNGNCNVFCMQKGHIANE